MLVGLGNKVIDMANGGRPIKMVIMFIIDQLLN